MLTTRRRGRAFAHRHHHYVEHRATRKLYTAPPKPSRFVDETAVECFSRLSRPRTASTTSAPPSRLRAPQGHPRPSRCASRPARWLGVPPEMSPTQFRSGISKVNFATDFEIALLRRPYSRKRRSNAAVSASGGSACHPPRRRLGHRHRQDHPLRPRANKAYAFLKASSCVLRLDWQVMSRYRTIST